jgi:hypothetical protein
MKQGILFHILWVVSVLVSASACVESLTFPDTASPELPRIKDPKARLLWIGPEYKVAVSATLEDNEGVNKIRIKNGEWELDNIVTVDNKASYILVDTFLVSRDNNPTEHILEFTITNSSGGILKTQVDVEDLSSENLIPGYDPDLLPPAITVTKPTVTKFYGLSSDPVEVEVDATITDDAISLIEIKVWGETAGGQLVSMEETVTPTTDPDKLSYHYNKVFNLPEGTVGEYSYIVKSTDASGNKSVKGGNITVGYLDRLYLSDAENMDEVTNQGYDHYGACRGIGTLLSMRKQGSNTFTLDYYYRNESSDNIRFVAFLGSDRPFITNQSVPNYTLDGPNVVALSGSEEGKIISDLSAATFKLPVSQKGYYHLTVDMTARTITAIPYTPTIPVDAVKYPGWSDANPWPYMAVTGPTVVGTAGWTEVGTSPKLMKEAEHPYLFTGTFQTNGTSSNMSLNAPLSVLGGDVWNKGWFRLKAGRPAMVDNYNDLITIIAPVGASAGGGNWGFSTSPVGTFKATYDIALQRFRIVRIGS